MWFKKRESAELLPDLPEPADLPKLSDFKDIPGLTTTSLPTLPEPTINSDFNQQAIKQAVVGEMQKSNFQIKSTRIEPSDRMVDSPKRIELPKTFEISKPNIKIDSKIKKAEPVYIRLDKFKSSMEMFEEIKNRVSEIESNLLNIKEIKEKEEKEITEWEKEVQIIKSSIETIENNIFKKLD